ncbi:MAG: NUDIX domain-containing protein [Patescibacteria group bacterium]
MGSVHVVAWREGKVAIVKNKERLLQNGRVKPAGWGLPSGRIREGETSFEAAARELREERNIFSAEIESTPIDVTVKSNGHIGVTFTAFVDPFEEIREPVFDPDGGVTDGAFIDPLTDLEERNGRFYFQGELFYSTHRTLIFMSVDPTGILTR